MVLVVIFWILLLLSFVSVLVPEHPYLRYCRIIDLILLAILGYKVFGGLS